MKRLWMRALLGFPLGICAGYLLMILYSLMFTPYHYTPVLPIFLHWMENSLHAVCLQVLLSGCVGCFTTSIVTLFEKETWSNGKAIGNHSLATCIMIFFNGYGICAFSPSFPVFILWICLLFLLLISIYAFVFHHVKKDVAYLNQQLSEFLKEDTHE